MTSVPPVKPAPAAPCVVSIPPELISAANDAVSDAVSLNLRFAVAAVRQATIEAQRRCDAATDTYGYNSREARTARNARTLAERAWEATLAAFQPRPVG
jgi:hypothetical protein